NLGIATRGAFEQAGVTQAFQLQSRLLGLVNRLDFNFGGLWSEGAHNQARAISEPMHSQQFMRRPVPGFCQTSNLIGSNYHVESNVAEIQKSDTPNSAQTIHPREIRWIIRSNCSAATSKPDSVHTTKSALASLRVAGH